MPAPMIAISIIPRTNDVAGGRPAEMGSCWLATDEIVASYSAKRTDGNGGFWTTCLSLRIRRSPQRAEGARGLAGLRSGDGR